MKKKLFIGALLLLISVVVLLTYALESHNPAPVILPNPNAYDVLVDAGSQVIDLPDDYAETNDIEMLQTFIDKHADTLNSLEEVHQLDCIVDFDRMAGLETVMAQTMPRSSSIRQAMRLMFAHGRLAEIEGNHALAAKRYAHMFASATNSAHQGLMVDYLQSIAAERQSLSQLSSLLDKLSNDEKLEVFAIIGTINRGPRNLDAIVLRERSLFRNQHGRLIGNWMIHLTKKTQLPAQDQFKQADRSVVELYDDVLGKLQK